MKKSLMLVVIAVLAIGSFVYLGQFASMCRCKHNESSLDFGQRCFHCKGSGFDKNGYACFACKGTGRDNSY